MKYLLLSVIVLFAGCKMGVSELLITKAAKEKEITQLKADYEVKIKEAEHKVEQAKDEIIEKKNEQIVGGSNAFYAQDMVFRTIPAPTRTDLVTHNFGEEGWTALGHGMPTYDTMLKINERLKNELDETKTSLADLKKSHDAAMTENQKLTDAEKKAEADLAKAKRDYESMEAQYNDKLDVLQRDLNAANDKIIATQKEDLNRKEEIKAIKTKFSMVCGAFALLCVLGTIYSPVLKAKLGLGAVVMGLISLGIWYVTPLMLGVGAGILIMSLVGWAVYDHFVENKAATGVYRAIQSVKDKSQEDYDRILKPELDKWITKYDKNGNPIPDTQAEKHIDKRLMETGDK